MIFKSTTERLRKAPLSRVLAIPRDKLDRILRRPSAPLPDAAKTYSVDEVQRFIEEQESDPGSIDRLRQARLREVNLRCEKLAQDLAERSGQLVRSDEMDKRERQLATGLRSKLYAGVDSELPPRLEGLSSAEIRAILKQWADEFCEEMQALGKQSL